MAVGGAAARDVAAEDRHRLFLILAHVDKIANDFRAVIGAQLHEDTSNRDAWRQETRSNGGRTTEATVSLSGVHPPCAPGTNTETRETGDAPKASARSGVGSLQHAQPSRAAP